ncbi:MAG: efflux RND transporter permease subunit [Acidobacteriota bacterium]|nr:efflux RND transporter permease subunit [Acidobacteriota bacterium]
MSRTSNPIVSFGIRRRITLTMVVAGVLVLGWISLTRLPLEFLPVFSSSSISVSVSYPSSSPEEISRLVVQPLEDSLGTISGIETLSSSADASSGDLRLSFVDGTDMDLAAVEVRDRIDRVRHLLPGDVDRISIRRFQSSDIPVISARLGSNWPRERLFDFAENTIQRRLERLEGVAQVSLRGVQTPKVQIDLDPDRLQAYGVSVRDLVARIRSENRDLTAGDVFESGKKLLVRTVGEFRSLDELRRLPLDDAGLRLADVAEVSYSFPRQEDFNFLNGEESVTVRINKSSTSNVLDVVDRVNAEMAEVLALPEAAGLTWQAHHDASIEVRQGLAQLRDAGLFGGGLAILAVFVFLRRVRTTLLIALAIPISVVGTFAAMYLMRQAELTDITLNVVSLAGLMLALGMLVDNSIVVIESIFRHRNELGEESRGAALKGASEVALPIVASTATTLCVFLPIIFMGGGGFMQTYMKNIATTICIVMLASLLVALTVVPMAAVLLLERQEARPPGLISRWRDRYAAVLAFTIRHRLSFLVSIVLMLWGAVALFKTIGQTFSTGGEERQVVISVDTPRQYSFDETRELYEELYRIFDSRRPELDIADIAYGFDRGTGRARGGWGGRRRFELFLVDESEAKLTTEQVRDRVRELLPVRAGVSLRLAESRHRSGSGGIEIELSGDSLAVLERLSSRLSSQLAALPMLKDVDTSLESGDEEIHVLVQDDRIARAGLSSSAVAAIVASSLSSRSVSRFQSGDREVDVIVQYREDERESLDQLEQVPILQAGVALPLAAVAGFERVAGPQRVERENHRSKVRVTANAEASATFMAMRTVGELMATFPLPPGYEWSFGRWNRYQQQDQAMSWFAIAFALVLVYMLMAALFESFAQPFTIMFSVPFALLGVAVVMKAFDQQLDSMANLGLIILLGVVVNNAIVLIDHINRLRKEGLSRDAAILQGGKDRLRPILITAVTTLVGLLPLVAPLILPSLFGAAEGRAGSWAPIGLVIMGGLTTSTFLTLIIIPTIYSLIDDLTQFTRRVARVV